MYAVVDCDNCFVSCERVFQPDLKGRPVVVLSNNDGCVVARSNEAKAIGIKMGTPIYQIMQLVREQNVQIRSSNYTLYADMSNRVMSILHDEVGSRLMEQYSIDEAFLELPALAPQAQPWKEWGEALVRKIGQWTGMPVSIGIGETRTLAKVATWFAKHYAGYNKVCIIDTPEKREAALKLLDVSEVWGVGWKSIDRYRYYGIQTAWDFTQRSASWIRSKFTVTGLRIWKELKGENCIESVLTGRRQTICTSRSFEHGISDLNTLEMHVGNFASHCARKLRKDKSAAQLVTVFLQTNHFRPEQPQYDPSATLSLITPASNDIEIVNAALRVLRSLYRTGFEFKRAGVIVGGICSNQAIQQDLFDDFTPEQRLRLNKLSKVMDFVNGRMGDDTIQLGIQQFPADIRTGKRTLYKDLIRHEYRSKCYSTSLKDAIETK